ncbi:MAG: hypothetical protein WDZ76_10385 [Pseudohongiellaceae bacterium]
MTILPKQILVLSSLLVASGTVAAQQTGSINPMIMQGNQELALSGSIDVPDFDEIDFDIDASYGYFFRDGWEVGARAIGADIGGVERFDFSVFTEYNFNRNSHIVPFVGASVGLATVNFDGDFDVDSTLGFDDDEATVFGFTGGIKWFIRDYMAVSTSIGFSVSTDDIYAADDELVDNLTTFRIGLRYYF